MSKHQNTENQFSFPQKSVFSLTEERAWYKRTGMALFWFISRPRSKLSRIVRQWQNEVHSQLYPDETD